MRTSLFILPGIGCLNQIGCILLFLACPIIALKGQENHKIEPYCKFLTLKQRWLTEDPGIQACDLREYGYNNCDLGFMVNKVKHNRSLDGTEKGMFIKVNIDQKSLNHFSAGISKRQRLNRHYNNAIQRVELNRNTLHHTNLIQNQNSRQNIRNVKEISRSANTDRLARKMQEVQRENKETRGLRTFGMLVVGERRKPAANKKQTKQVRNIEHLERNSRMIHHTSEIQQQNRKIRITNSVDRLVNEKRQGLSDIRENMQASFRLSLFQTPKESQTSRSIQTVPVREDERRDRRNKRDIRQETNTKRITRNKLQEYEENKPLEYSMDKHRRLNSAFTKENHERNTLLRESTLQRFQTRKTRTLSNIARKNGFHSTTGSTLNRRTREIRKSDVGNTINRRTSQQPAQEIKDRLSVSLERTDNTYFHSRDMKERLLLSRRIQSPLRQNRPLTVSSLIRADETEIRITRDSLTKHSLERTYKQVKRFEYLENNIHVRHAREMQRNEETRKSRSSERRGIQDSLRLYPELVSRSVRNSRSASIRIESSDILERRTSFMRRSLIKITTQDKNANLPENRDDRISGRSSLEILENRAAMRRNSAERINPDTRHFASQEFGRLSSAKIHRIVLEMPRGITNSQSLNPVKRIDIEMRQSQLHKQQSKTRETVKSAANQSNDRTSRSTRSLYLKHRESSTVIPHRRVDDKEKRQPHNDQNNKQLSVRHSTVGSVSDVLEYQKITNDVQERNDMNQRDSSRNTQDWRQLSTRHSQKGITEIRTEQRIKRAMRRSTLEHIQFRSLPSLNRLGNIIKTDARDVREKMELSRRRSTEYLKKEVRNKHFREINHEDKETGISRTLGKTDDQERRLSLNNREKIVESYRIHSIPLDVARETKTRRTHETMYVLRHRTYNGIVSGIRMVGNKISGKSLNQKNILTTSNDHVLNVARNEIRMENRLASREMRFNRESPSRYVERISREISKVSQFESSIRNSRRTRDVQVQDKTLISQSLIRIDDEEKRHSRILVDHRPSPLKHSTIRNSVLRESRARGMQISEGRHVSRGSARDSTKRILSERITISMRNNIRMDTRKTLQYLTKQNHLNFENVEQKEMRLSRDILDSRHPTLRSSLYQVRQVRVANRRQTRIAQAITNYKLIREIPKQVKQTSFAPSYPILDGPDSRRSLNYLGAISNIAFTKENMLVCKHKNNISKEAAFASLAPSFICDKISSGLQDLNKRLRKLSMNVLGGTSINGLVTGGFMAVTLFLNINTKRLFF